MEGNTPYWMPISIPPPTPGDYIVHGPEVSGRVGGKYSCWLWDGMSWWAEDGTEIAEMKQMRDACWVSLPRYPC